MVMLAWVGRRCMLNCSRMVVAAEEASVFKTSPSLVIHGWLFLLLHKRVLAVGFRVFHGCARLGWTWLHSELFSHVGCG